MRAPRNLHDLIDDAHSDMQFGTVTLTLKKSYGLITAVDTTKNSERKVSGNAQALTLIGSMLKLLGQNHETGQLTFTVGMRDGEATLLLTHDFRRNDLDRKTGEFK